MEALKTSKWCRFRPRVSMRGLLVAVALFGMFFAYLGMKWRSAKRQEAALTAIESHGLGGWGFDYRLTRRFNSNPQSQKQNAWAPEWLSDRLGPHFFQTVRVMGFGHPGNPANRPDWPKTRDDSMELLRDFPGLRELEMFCTDLTDRGIEQLVEHCPEMHFLTLWLNKHITPESMKSIKKLRRLHSFYCVGVLNSDEGLVHLKELPHLRELDLVDFRDKPGITDAGLKHVGEMRSLVYLQIHMSSITDEGLMHLKDLSELERLSLSDTRVTEAGVQRLQLALPNCKITGR
jgi:hypothetical protein